MIKPIFSLKDLPYIIIKHGRLLKTLPDHKEKALSLSSFSFFFLLHHFLLLLLPTNYAETLISYEPVHLHNTKAALLCIV